MNLWRFFRRAQRDHELTGELETHLAHDVEEMIARGMPPEEAQLAARRRLGNATAVREAVYDMSTLTIVERFWSDLRFAARMLRRSPVFTLTAVLSLALGIGANSAIFQLLNAIRMRSLPVENAGELVKIRAIGDGRSGRQTGRNRQVSKPLWEQIEREQQAFSGVLAFGDTRFNLSPQGEVRYVEGLWVSGGFFPVLGVKPLLGRLFSPADDRPGCGYFGAVISHSLWQRDFGGAPDVLGKVLAIGADRVPIIGVTPEQFFGVEVGRRFDVALPICTAGFDERNHFWLGVMGRLKAGWSIEQVNSHLKTLAPRILAETVPPTYRADGVQKYMAVQFEAQPAATGVSPLRARTEDALWVLLTISGMVLLIASVNVANLMLARATARGQEFAVRLSLGASRGQVVRQVLVEGLLLAGFGTFAGMLLASWSGGLLVGMVSTGVDPIYLDLAMDWRVLAFTSVVAGLTCMLFSMAPAVQAIRSAGGSRPGGRGLTTSRNRFIVRRALIAVQVALSFVLLSGALLFTRSFRNLMTVDTGFTQDGILTANLFFQERELPRTRRESFYRELAEQLRAIPDVNAVADASSPPLSGGYWDTSILTNGERRGSSNLNQVSSGYFNAMRTPLLAGRDFGPQDTVSSPKVAVVTETFARNFLQGPQAVGQTFAMPGGAGQPDTHYQVIGLVKDSKYYNIREEFSPLAFIASAQEPNPGLTRRYLLRATGAPGSVMYSVKRLVANLSPGAAMRFSVLRTQVEESLLRERLMATLSGFFGLVAVVLAVVGLYGVLSYVLAKRQNEIGIRMALGADRTRILRMVFADVAFLLAAGLIVGAPISVVSARAAKALLYGLEPYDPATLALTGALLAAAGCAAAFWPALRASGVPPCQALRE